MTGLATVHPISGAPDRFSSGALAGLRFVAQRGLLKAVVWSSTRVHVHGSENVADLTGPFVAIANHSSHLDAPLIMGSLPRRNARYLAAGAAADYFFDVWWRRGLTALFFNAFPIDRTGQLKRAGISKGLLNRGVPLLVFPEGTRSRTGRMGRFSHGAAGLAISCHVPVVPVGLIGAADAMPRGRNWPGPGRPEVHVVLGAPMTPAAGENAEKFSRRMRAEVIRLRETVTGPAAATREHHEKGIA